MEGLRVSSFSFADKGVRPLLPSLSGGNSLKPLVGSTK